MPANPDNFEERLVLVTDAFAALIAADSYFAGTGSVPVVPVLTERKGDINATIAQALAKLGLCVVVVAAEADALERSGEAFSLRVRLVAQVMELPLINQGASGTKKPALAAATRILKAVDCQPNGLDVDGGRHQRGLNEFLLDVDQPFKLTADPRYLVYQISAFTTVEL